MFRFTQVELPWPIGPPDGRYLVRASGDAVDAPPTHVLVIMTLGAVERRLLKPVRRRVNVQPEPEPTPVATGRATVIDVAAELPGETAARAWLDQVDEEQLEADLEVLNRALQAFRLVTADPYQKEVTRGQVLVARVGYGAGEQVADGVWTDARELTVSSGRRRRATVLAPQARLAAMLAGRQRPLVCEELTLRARLDLDHGRDREAALQVLVALDAAVAELPVEPDAAGLEERIGELRSRRDAVAIAAQAALAGPLGPGELEDVSSTLGRIEAALRARAIADA